MFDSQLTSVLEEKSVSEVIRERRSVRHYDPNIKISREVLTEIMQQATLAPSGGNLQSWRFLVIDSPDLKQKLLPIAYNQHQVVEASAVIAVLGDLECFRLAEKIYGQAVDAGFMSEDTAKTFIKRYTNLYSSMSSEEVHQVICTDCGLVSMQLMLIARAKGYDTGPMGGYDKKKFIEAFGISNRYEPVLLITIGKAAKAGHPTVRLQIDDVAFFNDMVPS